MRPDENDLDDEIRSRLAINIKERIAGDTANVTVPVVIEVLSAAALGLRLASLQN